MVWKKRIFVIFNNLSLFYSSFKNKPIPVWNYGVHLKMSIAPPPQSFWAFRITWYTFHLLYFSDFKTFFFTFKKIQNGNTFYNRYWSELESDYFREHLHLPLPVIRTTTNLRPFSIKFSVWRVDFCFCFNSTDSMNSDFKAV